ncbi:AraC family transcriptional regulator [Lactobacillus sp. 0.1XD8-4]|uniref:AraC family transcriptional regulator n=1 Tax=Limosilactobacillus walteri TaxID=2268022 RepID=A0ABR8P9I4_9LACO|nr:AraC family transcriptional regulator [Limosilactobacillus walteri]MBD5807329.1 AraC family transcriptional regulator [Limosilactobacillus walteri]MRN06701.1 AraC family transcriptional regulator [Lactobacillus sp. 0.1XD8-4]
MLKNFISIPTIESGLYMFGGHKHTVNGGWSFFEQKHQVFEVMVVTDGSQLTSIRDQGSITLGPGDVIIIAPGTLHTNSNISKIAPMTYMCLHFDFEDVQLRSQIISLISNKLIPANSQLANVSYDMLKEIINLCRDKKHTSDFNVQVEIEILLLQYLKQVNLLIKKEYSHNSSLPFSNKEAQISRDLVIAIENRVNNDDEKPSFNFSDLCKELGISSGYGHRVFKKVYGTTPLHFIDREKYKKAQRLLEYSGNSIEEVAYMVGAANISIFSKQFKKWSGYSPSEFRKQIIRKRSVKSKNRTGYFE